MAAMAYSWDDLRVFLAAHRTESLNKTARELGISLSTASRRLAAFEQAVGVPLFSRSASGLRPTQAAAAILADAERMERLAGSIGRRLADQAAVVDGVVRIACTPSLASLVLFPFLDDLLTPHPGLAVEVLAGPGLADLEGFEADVAVRTCRPEAGENLVVRRLRQTHLGVFASRSYVARRGRDLERGEHHWTGLAGRMPDHPLEQLRLRLAPASEVRLRAQDYRTLADALRAGLGVGFLPVTFGRLLPSLVQLPVPLPEVPGPSLWLVGHRATRHTPAVSAVWDFLRALLDEHTDEPLAGSLQDRFDHAFGA